MERRLCAVRLHEAEPGVQKRQAKDGERCATTMESNYLQLFLVSLGESLAHFIPVRQVSDHRPDESGLCYRASGSFQPQPNMLVSSGDRRVPRGKTPLAFIVASPPWSYDTALAVMSAGSRHAFSCSVRLQTSADFPAGRAEPGR